MRSLQLLELVEERRRLAIAIRVDERDAVRQLLVGDVAQHRAEDGDADTAGDEDVVDGRVLGQEEGALRLLDLDLVPDLELGERALEGGVAESRREPDAHPLGRRGDERDVAARPFSSWCPRSGSSTQK